MKTNLMKIKEIVSTKQYKKMGKFIVDMQTARAILEVRKALNPKNKAKYERIINADIRKASSIAWKMVR